MSPRRWSVGIVGTLLLVTVATALWSASTAPKAHHRAGVAAPQPAVVTLPAPATSAPPAGPPVVVDPDFPTTVIDPDTYRPTYDTIASLVDDSAFVFIGTAGPRYTDPNVGTATPFTVDRILAGTQPRTLPVPALPEGLPGDIPVVVGRSYVVFLGLDLTGDALPECVVGGTRGLFRYDAATRTVTRVATGPSPIPTTESLAQFVAQIPNPAVLNPTKVPTPSVCSPSVTGR